MKRKRPVAPITAAEKQPIAAVNENVVGLSLLDVGKCVVFALLLFFAMTLQTGRMSMLLVVLALLSFIGKEPFRFMRERFCLPVIGLLGFMIMVCCAAVYSHFGSYAVKEFYKYLAAFSLSLILLARFEKKHVSGLLWGFAAVSAVISLLCIDAASSSVLYDGFVRLMEALGGSFSDVKQDVWGTRVAGIYNDANVSASILALGSLVTLYLVNNEKVIWKKAAACVLLGMSAMGFFLSMSRGAILCFVLALLVWLLTAGKDRRLPLFFLMFFSAVVTVAGSMLAIPAITEGSWLPDLVVLFSGLVIFLLDWAVAERAARALEGKGKAVAVVIGVLAVVSIGYCIAALTMTGPYTLNSDDVLIRNLSVEPGAYTLSGEWSGDVHVSVRSQTKIQVVTSDVTVLYNGPVDQASFTVPEDTVNLSVWFETENGAYLEAATLSDGTKVPLRYPLLPDFVANRLQGNLFSSISFLLRVQYLKDAWTLFTQSPLIGHGLGSTEGLYTSVQPFFYESKYVHNHVLQVMSDMGLLGLVGFMVLLGGALWLLLKNLRSETSALAAMLLACWVMMNAHSLMEINFSVRAYLCAALCVLLLSVLLYAEPLKVKAAKLGSAVLAMLLWITLAVSGGLAEGHRMVLREMKTFSTDSVSMFMNTTKKFISRDRLDHEQNQLNYVGNAALLKDPQYNGPMRKYVEELRASGTYTACSGLARYYYLPRGEFEELFACSREGIAQEASAADAWNLQLNFYRNEVLAAAGTEHMDEFIDGVLTFRDYLAEYSQGRLEEIKLTEENQAFLDAVSSVQDAGMEAKAAWLYLTEILGYGKVE